MSGTVFAKKEDRLKEAASTYLKCGRFKDFCEVQCELGNWKKAMAFAPAVSIEYWQELAERHTKFLSDKQSEKAPQAALISNQCNLAVKLFMDREDFEDGKVLRALQLTGTFKSVLDDFVSKPTSQHKRDGVLNQTDLEDVQLR